MTRSRRSRLALVHGGLFLLAGGLLLGVTYVLVAQQAPPTCSQDTVSGTGSDQRPPASPPDDSHPPTSRPT